MSYSACNNKNMALDLVKHLFKGNSTIFEWIWVLAALFVWPIFLDYPRHSTIGFWPDFHRNRLFSWGFVSSYHLCFPPNYMQFFFVVLGLLVLFSIQLLFLCNRFTSLLTIASNFCAFRFCFLYGAPTWASTRHAWFTPV